MAVKLIAPLHPEDKDTHALGRLASVIGHWGLDRTLFEIIKLHPKQDHVATKLVDMIRELKESADDTGCSEDLVVVGRKELTALLEYLGLE